MLFSLIEKLPIDVVGATVLHYLDIKDIVRLERACVSKASHKLFLDLIALSTAVALHSFNEINISCYEWFALRQVKIKFLTITLPGNNAALHAKKLKVNYVYLCLKVDVTMDCCTYLFNSHLLYQVKRMSIYGDQNKEVMDQLSLLAVNVENLHISGSYKYRDWLSKDILARWKLKEITLYDEVINVSNLT